MVSSYEQIYDSVFIMAQYSLVLLSALISRKGYYPILPAILRKLVINILVLNPMKFLMS
jgi:hypothetical protein